MTKMPNGKKAHEPLFHISKRASLPRPIAYSIRVGSILIAILFCAFLSFLILGANIGDFFSAMFKGSFGHSIYTWKYFKDVAILLCISVAVTPAFRMKFWNIGANGQALVGALASVACIWYWGKSMPQWLLLIVMFLAAVLAGMIWAVIPAIFKALWNTNETLFTLMMNYISIYLVEYFLRMWLGQTPAMNALKEGRLPELRNIPALKSIDPRGFLLIIIIVSLITLAMYFYLRYSKHGYEISVVGESENTARYIGINVKKVIIRTMLLSGALCGLTGFLIVSGLSHNINSETIGSLGFTAIMVSWLANFNPLLMFLTSGLIIFLEKGGNQLSTSFNVSSAFPNMVIGIVLLFFLGSEFFIRYQIKIRKTKREVQ